MTWFQVAVLSMSVSSLMSQPIRLQITHVETNLYSSENLSGHQVSAECNPGGGTECPCSGEDVAIRSLSDHAEVTSNVRLTNTWANAIGYKKFAEQFATGNPIRLGRFRYAAWIRLPVLPKPDPNQHQNPEAVHLMVQLWDGRNALWPANQQTLEGTIFWELNPWSADFGKIKVYTFPIALTNTGLRLSPDISWHHFSLDLDLASKRYLSVSVDGQSADLHSLPLAEVPHPDWGTDVSLSLTTESLASWPQTGCSQIFWWTTQFKNVSFYSVRDLLAWASSSGQQYQIQISPDLRQWLDFGPAQPGTGATLIWPFDVSASPAFFRLSAPSPGGP